jgi:hypothetical protein
MRLNDDRQGEGGTLAVIVHNITTTTQKMQDFCIRKSLKIYCKIIVP